MGGTGIPQQLSHHRSSIRKVAAPSMQLHHCDSNCLAGSQHNLQQGLGAASGATSGTAAMGSHGGWLPRSPGRWHFLRERVQRWLQHSWCLVRKDSRLLQQSHQLSGREGPPVCDTCHGVTGPRDTASHGHQPRLSFSAVWSAGTSCARAGGCLLPFTGRLSRCQCHLITIQEQPTRSPLQHAHCPSAKDVCSPYPDLTQLAESLGLTPDTHA